MIVERVSMTLDEQKFVMLNILKEFANFCDQHGLMYYLDAGTLIGAVRHKGFIPWDDDIDINMPQVDYDRFIALTKNKVDIYQNIYKWNILRILFIRFLKYPMIEQS